MLAAAAVAAALVLPPPALAAGDTVLVNGTKLSADAIAQLDERTYVSLQPVARALGATVAYDGKSKQATLTTVLAQIVFRVDDNTVTVNGVAKTLEAPAREVGGRVMLPLRGLATALDANLKLDSTKHQIDLVMNASAAPQNAPTPPPIQSANTLEGTVVSVDAGADVPQVDIDVKGMEYTVTVPPNTKIQFRDTHGGVASEGTLAQVKPGDTLIATLDSQGRVLSIGDVFSGTSGTITSVAGMNMVLSNGRVITADEHATSVIVDGGAATMADLRPGDIVTVRSDPRTGKVREVVAFSPSHTAATASPSPSATTASGVEISGVNANAEHPLHVGQTLTVSFEGTPGGAASFDLSNVVLGTPMREVRPGYYEGSYVVQVGTNVVDAPLLVTLSKGGQSAHAVGPVPLNIITEAPQVKTTAPGDGARINTLRPSIYVTFETIGGKGMDPATMQLLVDGKDVTSQATKTGAFISYFPGSDLHDGRIDVRVRGSDVAGNQLDYSWSFVISTK
ncbi:MAG: copper amine oxidase N-terminal domain-containing protein [Candidatus Eremiobacteraeota bacterium]|nr:copper amine oxidase N-terminal domain-containing protein [Candidatus Eremiobacteraeota bacterium]